MKYKNIDEKKVIDFYLQPNTIKRTAKEFNVSGPKIKSILVKNNISLHSKEVTEKLRVKYTKETCLERYGVDNTFQLPKAQENLKKAYKERKDEIWKKIKQTNLERYGDPNYHNIEKAKKTNLERYGVENTYQIKGVPEKAKKAAGSKEALEKKERTNLERYGAKYPIQLEYFKEKIKNTNLEKYGVENISQYKPSRVNVAKKTEQTCLERYGVSWPVFTENCKKAATASQSKPNTMWEQFLQNSNIKYSREFVIGHKSYDFKIDNILLEINPSATHNSTWGIKGKPPIDKNYHKDKSQLAKDGGYQCICVWDWDDEQKVINLLKKRETIYARNCIVKEVNKEDAQIFLNDNHLQGYVKDEVSLGLYYNDNLVSIMTFGKPRYNRNYDYELLRYCSIYNVIGGANKLFSHFIDTFEHIKVISYCDLSKFSGKVYENLGFTLLRINKPSKHWYNIKTKQHITDNLLRQRGFDQLFKTNYGKGTSNEELMLQHKFVEVYDCGQASYKFVK